MASLDNDIKKSSKNTIYVEKNTGRIRDQASEATPNKWWGPREQYRNTGNGLRHGGHIYPRSPRLSIHLLVQGNNIAVGREWLGGGEPGKATKHTVRWSELMRYIPAEADLASRHIDQWEIDTYKWCGRHLRSGPKLGRLLSIIVDGLTRRPVRSC